MYKNLIHLLTVLVLLPSCSESTPPKISVVCEENNVGNCIVKWEMSPLIKGQVKVYASTNPNIIPEDFPVAMAQISDEQLTIINNEPSQRFYYSIVFNNQFRVKTSTRNVNLLGIQNFRDLGGYASSATGKNVRWGMIYRSAQIDTLYPCVCRKLHHMGIKTFIDLRSRKEYPLCENKDNEFNIVHIPILTGNMEQVLKYVEKNQIDNDTIDQWIKQINRNLVTNYHKELNEIFHILLDKENYPLVIHCASGNNRTGIVTALILGALGVDEDIIMQDYRLSNEYFNITKASEYAYKLPSRTQEAITTVYSAKDIFLNAAKEQIESEYGSVKAYLKKAIKLNEKEIERLQSIMLE